MSSIIPPPPGSGLRQVVVVATDFSDQATLALQTAIRMSNGPESELHVVHVTGEVPGLTKGTRIKNQAQRIDDLTGIMKRYVHNQIELMGMPTLQRVITHVLPGEPAQAILQLTVDVHADLLVVGTHEEKGLRRWFLGSVEQELTRRAHCPVMVARPTSYAGIRSSDSVLPPCPDCLKVREETHQETFWCELHARDHVETHVVVGSQSPSVRPASFNIPLR